ncbi:hypothetical protein NliqN6_4896 [Naganishia liquefaciens]|uniref:Uncharacterized protein n=1 Tax=Naganishia liquefaciens TaxID=104408 RepID=A0A8H3YG96_9TREE|nr:hypothetical protein NliqN6_4896 [Naganishia liquefaciens]
MGSHLCWAQSDLVRMFPMHSFYTLASTTDIYKSLPLLCSGLRRESCPERPIRHVHLLSRDRTVARDTHLLG